MLEVAELKRWLNTLAPSDAVGIDEGGLTLVSLDEPYAHMEVGGYVTDEEREAEDQE